MGGLDLSQPARLGVSQAPRTPGEVSMTVRLSGLILNLTTESWQRLNNQLGLEDLDCPQYFGNGPGESGGGGAAGAWGPK
jgi:hypothetical protein